MLYLDNESSKNLIKSFWLEGIKRKFYQRLSPMWTVKFFWFSLLWLLKFNMGFKRLRNIAYSWRKGDLFLSQEHLKHYPQYNAPFFCSYFTF